MQRSFTKNAKVNFNIVKKAASVSSIKQSLSCHISTVTEVTNENIEKEDREFELSLTDESERSRSPPAPPTNCCMSGCHNCVWLEYADRLRQHYCDVDHVKARVSIEREVEDPNLKAFLLLELKLNGN